MKLSIFSRACLTSLLYGLFQSFCPLIYWSVFFLLTFVRFCCCCSGHRSFTRGMMCKYFLLVGGLSFNSLNGVFRRAENSTFEDIQLIDCSFMDCGFGITSTKSSPNPRSQGFSPMVFYRRIRFYM